VRRRSQLVSVIIEVVYGDARTAHRAGGFDHRLTRPVSVALDGATHAGGSGSVDVRGKRGWNRGPPLLALLPLPGIPRQKVVHRRGHLGVSGALARRTGASGTGIGDVRNTVGVATSR